MGFLASKAQKNYFISTHYPKSHVKSSIEFNLEFTENQIERQILLNKKLFESFYTRLNSKYQITDNNLLNGTLIGVCVNIEKSKSVGVKNHLKISSKKLCKEYKPLYNSSGINLSLGSVSHLSVCSIKSLSGTPFIEGFKWVIGISASFIIDKKYY